MNSAHHPLKQLFQSHYTRLQNFIALSSFPNYQINHEKNLNFLLGSALKISLNIYSSKVFESVYDTTLIQKSIDEQIECQVIQIQSVEKSVISIHSQSQKYDQNGVQITQISNKKNIVDPFKIQKLSEAYFEKLQKTAAAEEELNISHNNQYQYQNYQTQNLADIPKFRISRTIIQKKMIDLMKRKVYNWKDIKKLTKRQMNKIRQ